MATANDSIPNEGASSPGQPLQQPEIMPAGPARDQNTPARPASIPNTPNPVAAAEPDVAIPDANAGQNPEDDASKERRRRLAHSYDRRLMPICFLAFLFFFLDKSNIAFARIHGLQRDLELGQYQFNLALIMFFLPAIMFTLPGNLVLRAFGGARMLSLLVFVWGGITVGTAFVKNAEGLYASRAFLGVAEGSFLGCSLIYLGFFYNQDELILRIGALYAASPIAGSLGGLLAGALGGVRYTINGHRGWPWIFLVEGIITMMLGVLAFLLLPNTPAELLPGNGTQLDQLELEEYFTVDAPGRMARRRAAIREPGEPSNIPVEALAVAKSITLVTYHDKLGWKLTKRAVQNTMTLVMAVGAFFSIEAIYSYALFLPTIIHTMGFQAIKASLMTAPPNFVGFVGTIVTCLASHRVRRTGVFLTSCAVIGIVGYAMLLVGGLLGRPGQLSVIAVQYAGTFLVSLAVHPLPPLALTWIHVNTSPHYVRAIAIGFVMGVGNFAPFLSSFTYLQREAPAYTRGHATNLGCLVGLLVISLATPFWMRRENFRRDCGERDYRLDPSRYGLKSQEQYELELGWLHPKFRYRI